MKILAFAPVLLALACSQGSTPPPEAASHEAQRDSVCVEIATACHEHEGHSAKAKECHEMGHSKETTEAQCQARRAECLDECNMAAKAGPAQPH